MKSIRLELLDAIKSLGELYPDMRFGQLIVNLSNWATERVDAVYDVEDEELLAVARDHLKRRAGLAGKKSAAPRRLIKGRR